MYAPVHSTGEKLFNVNPGDIIEASVFYLFSNQFLLSVSDVTTGESYYTIQACDASATCWRGTAEWVVERPGGGNYRLADFGTVAFTNINEPSAGPNPTFTGIEMVQKGTNIVLSTCQAYFISYDCTWQAAGH